MRCSQLKYVIIPFVIPIVLSHSYNNQTQKIKLGRSRVASTRTTNRENQKMDNGQQMATEAEIRDGV